MDITRGEIIGAAWGLSAGAAERANAQQQATILSGYIARGMTLEQAQRQMAADFAYANRNVNPYKLTWLLLIPALIWGVLVGCTLVPAVFTGNWAVVGWSFLFGSPAFIWLAIEWRTMKKGRAWKHKRRPAPARG